MKRATHILLLGFCLAMGAYWGAYLIHTTPRRAALNSEVPELSWLKTEFELNDEEFARISRLHQAYLPQCEARCSEIDATNAVLERLLAGNHALTPEIEQAIQNGARLRAKCQKEMLKHFYEVSRSMPPEQGRRYFEWVKERTLLIHHAMLAQH